MSEDLVTLEVDGRTIQAPSGQMLIEAADQAGIYIPRFCYHKKLSVVANCRMCLVEVERAKGPVPACATPVREGMRVFTKSELALDAQRGTMEFLLINHPLDCPVCDQGGECELQDIALGFGEGVSRYTEAKRVVKDKDIGPLVSTDMTRCIHCTRCVRFGEEIAGLPELGATGRGEEIEIGTYVEKSLESELAGNVIDLCPVGALNAKPSRFAGRSWEMLQHRSVAPHDAFGSNIYLHTLRSTPVRVVPAVNEAVNETWLSDRDRFSYQGITAEDRLALPMIKQSGQWQQVDWETALNRAASALTSVDPERLGAWLSPQATLEELYLSQQLLRTLGCENIDHRLRQTDFSDQASAPLFPWLGMGINAIEQCGAILLVGAAPRQEEPLFAHRLRKAALAGANMAAINPRDVELRFPLHEQIIASPLGMLRALAGVLKAALQQAGQTTPAELAELLAQAEVTAATETIANMLGNTEQAAVFLGQISENHPYFSQFRALAAALSDVTGAHLGYTGGAANAAGAWLAGALPHRQAGGQAVAKPGLHAGAMRQEPLDTYFLLNVEPADCADPAAARQALEQARQVVLLTPYAADATWRYADVVLPIGTFAETAGTFVNGEGRWQSFDGALRPHGEARPGWKVLRVLANIIGLTGFDMATAPEVRDALKAVISTETELSNRLPITSAIGWPDQAQAQADRYVGNPPMYQVDPLVRRSPALQQTPQGQAAACLRLPPGEAEALGVADGDPVEVRQQERLARATVMVDAGLAAGCIWLPMGLGGEIAVYAADEAAITIVPAREEQHV